MTDETTPELLPCWNPSCTGKVMEGHIRDGGKVFCADCGLTIMRHHGPDATGPERARTAWNTRATQAPLIAAMREGVEAAWRSIESAPKDGTRIIAAHIGWCYSRARLDKWDLEDPKDEYRVFWATSAQFDVKRDRWTDGIEGIIPPTHWMPLTTPEPDRGPQGCSVPPAGWYCVRQKGHDGPCAAVEARTALTNMRDTLAKIEGSEG